MGWWCDHTYFFRRTGKNLVAYVTSWSLTLSPDISFFLKKMYIEKYNLVSFFNVQNQWVVHYNSRISRLSSCYPGSKGELKTSCLENNPLLWSHSDYVHVFPKWWKERGLHELNKRKTCWLLVVMPEHHSLDCFFYISPVLLWASWLILFFY